MMLRRILVAAGLATALASSAAAEAADSSRAQEAVFGRQHLDNIAAPTTLQYAFERSGLLLPDLVDRAELAVLKIGPDGRKQVELRLYTGPEARRVSPPQGYRNNPMIVLFLQRDVEQMSRMTGGSPNYFRNRIRAAFAEPAAVQAETVTFSHDGRPLEGTKVTVRPFVNDPQIPRYAEFQHKRYEFVLTPEIPGGVYSLRAVTPNGTEGPLLEESMTYEGEARPGVGESG